ncbi:uncharacterized protein LOC122791273 [Protopterus annectens]|uniref:uncharacterized protein LOC122791273 n=1 Tax=Protopterus annectens TaxID=7888 RepID=UPI001CFA78E1|nr:uncharacterized protein LOC122791273 [Protopterus annectens]
MTAQEIVAFKADNGKFWSVINYGSSNTIEAAKSSLDCFCEFLVCPASCGKIYIKTPHGMYLSRINHGATDIIEPAKKTPDVYCEFQLFIQDGKMVLKADNGKYLSRINRGGKDNIEPAKQHIDEYCLFEVIDPKNASLGILALFANNCVPVSFKTDLGHFWSVVQNGDAHTIEAPDSAMTPSAEFLMEKTPCGKILLKTPQNMYLSRINRGIDFIEAAKATADVYCQYTVSHSYKMVLQADNGKYLSRIRRGSTDNIEAAKQDIDVFCQFDVVPYSG